MKEQKRDLVPFSSNQLLDRDLVIRMLCYEEQLATGEWGQSHYKDPSSRASISLDNEYAFNRRTLHDFGFDPSDQSVSNYRSIFRTYYNDPDNYDKEVINSSYYMRNNRCVFYRAEPLKVGTYLPNCRLYELDGTTETNLHDAIRDIPHKWKKAIICAFSNS
jgi:hypothetical protein